MIRTYLKSKIHRATVTEAELDYDGSVSIDEALLELADIRDHEQVDIYNITRGTRLTTYAILAERNSGRICINGAAAHLMNPGDMVIICSYAQFLEAELPHTPIVVKVDGNNKPQTSTSDSSP
ncbi:MAG: aspartate 1-decarboxylase [Pirellulales bacterium]|jgi:aspartate 1-decarboxylase|nr:aspartate 1-decarboxylase [Rhodopirellula sp.]MCH2370478.1 aspartate 1-decarboxylase [Pirellulales bacterium]|tara:strand:- start:955 stop:1323 length:369 start_codon:yes stop_codon:yes gene_type:complete